MPPSTFGRYEVVCEIGEGAMGRVYRAQDPMVGRPVAIKTIKSEYLTKDNAAEYVKRFRREAQAAGVLTHPNIVSIFDVGDGFLVMEYLEGQSLDKLLEERGRLEPDEALRILTPVADALDHAHRAGIIHRDIKPANVMVLKDGRPKLMDFGVAHFEASLMTTTGQVLGSPSYMAPEQIAGAELTPKADVYSLAVVAYETLTGQRPFQGTSITSIIYRVMSEQPPPPRRWNAALPPHYDDVFQRALAKDPAARHPSASALMAALALKEYDVTLASVLDEALDLPTVIVPGAAAPPAKASSSSATAASLPTAVRPAGAPGSAASPPEPVTEAMAPVVPAPTPTATTDVRPPARRPAVPWPWIAAAVVVAAAAGILLLRGGGVSAPAPTSVAAASPAAPEVPPGTAPEAPPLPGATQAVAAPEPVAPPTPLPRPSAKPRAPRPRPTPTPLVEGALVELGPDVTPPRRISGESASYPEQAERRKLTGTVAIAMIVDASGQPTDLTVVESAGEILDRAVLDAVRTWRFEPARKGGVKVSVRWTFRQIFKRGP